VRVLSTVISLPEARRKALVHLSFRGLRFILNFGRISEGEGRGEREGGYIFVAFRAAEFEEFGVVADKSNACTGEMGGFEVDSGKGLPFEGKQGREQK